MNGSLTYEQIVEIAKNVLQAPVLLAVAGALISFLTSYIPGFREWYAAKTATEKALGQLIAVTVVTLLVGILSWTRILVIVPDGVPGIVILIFSWGNALFANQTTYKMTTQPKSVLAIKERAKSLSVK